MKKTKIGQDWHYVTYGGGPEGGYVILGDAWYSWNRGWGTPLKYEAIDGKILVWKFDGFDNVKLVSADYKLKDDEMLFDDIDEEGALGVSDVDAELSEDEEGEESD